MFGEQTFAQLRTGFTSTENIGLLGTGAQYGHLDFHTSPELCPREIQGVDFVWTHPLHDH